jgi:hypothetical protein
MTNRSRFLALLLLCLLLVAATASAEGRRRSVRSRTPVCTWSLQGTFGDPIPDGGMHRGQIRVTGSPANCTDWSAFAYDSWVTVEKDATTAYVTVLPNMDATVRTAQLTIAGHRFDLTQLGRTEVADPNLLTNAKFDTDLRNWGWLDRFPNGNGTATWSSLDANDNPASGSMRLTDDVDSGPAYQQLQCVNDVVPGALYDFGAAVRASSRANAKPVLVVVEYDAPNCAGGYPPYQARTVTVAQPNVWQRQQYTVGLSFNAKSVSLIVAGWARAEGLQEVWIDDVFLRPRATTTERRGAVAFHYGPALTDQQLEFFGKFDVLVTHDPLPAAQVEALHARGTRLALYEWTVAFYRALVQSGSWQERLLSNRTQLLNSRPLHGHAGAADAEAFYYDPHDYAAARSNAIEKRLQSIGYDGVFFDTTTVQSVHPEALAEYERRHREPYDAAVSRFLAALRAKDVLIVTNQGYRAAEHYLPHAHYDITESLLSRPWHDASNRWNSVDFLVPELIVPVAARYPHVHFVHLNYGSDPQRIVATARLFDHDAFVASPDVMATVFSDVYFFDPGRPVSGIRCDGVASTREFERARVVVTPQAARIER